MDSYHLKVGAFLNYNGSDYQITAEDEEERFELKRLSDELHIRMQKDELLDCLIDGSVKFLDPHNVETNKSDQKSRLTADFLTFSESEKAIARRKLKYVKAIIAANLMTVKPQTINEVIDAVAKQINDEKKPHWTTVYRWHRDYLESDSDVRALSTNRKRKGNRLPRLRPEVQDIIDDVINNYYLTRERPSIKSTYTQICMRIQESNDFRESDDQLNMPTYMTIRRKIQKLPPEVVTEKHFSKHRAKTDFRAYQKGPEVSRILERVEADHTPLPCIVVDDYSRLPLGRPTLTCLIDHYSKAVVGFYLSFSDPGTTPFFEALKYAIFPKTFVKKIYPNVQNDWECFGIPENLIVDNGKEFHSKSFDDTCNALGIPYQYAPPLYPWYKSLVERHFRTLNESLLTRVPGKTFANIMEKDDYDPAKNAVVSFTSMQELIHIWVVDIYNRTYQESIDSTPAQIWHESAKLFPPRLPSDLNRIDIELGLMKDRKIGKEGIQFEKLKYNSEELGALRRKLPEKHEVKIKINRNDISYINVLDPITNRYFIVPASNQRLTRGKTLYQLLTIRKESKRIENSTDVDSLLRAERRITDIIEKELKKTKNVTSRKRSAKYRNLEQDISALTGIGRRTTGDPHIKPDMPPTTTSFQKPDQKDKSPETPVEDFYADDDEWKVRDASQPKKGDK